MVIFGCSQTEVLVAIIRNVPSPQYLPRLVALCTTINLAVLVLLVSVAAAQTLDSAQQPAQHDPQAAIILNQSYKAMGMVPPVAGMVWTTSSGAPLQDSVATGTITFEDGTSGTIVVKSRGGSQLRNEVTRNGKQFTNVVGAGSGNRQQDGQKVDLPAWVSQYQRPEHIPAFSRMADFVLANTVVAYIGLEDVAGRKAQHLRFSSLPTDGTPPEVEELLSEFHVFVDAQSMLVSKTRGYLFSPEIIENRIPVENYYADYRLASGILVPYHITRYVSGTKYSEITFASVSINVGLADSDFQ